jgi:hypothetical protein
MASKKVLLNRALKQAAQLRQTLAEIAKEVAIVDKADDDLVMVEIRLKSLKSLHCPEKK